MNTTMLKSGSDIDEDCAITCCEKCNSYIDSHNLSETTIPPCHLKNLAIYLEPYMQENNEKQHYHRYLLRVNTTIVVWDKGK